MSVYWEQNLTVIREQLLMMSGLVERNLVQSARALLERDAALADLVEEEDGEVDELEKKIDDLVITYISTHGPMARDCRFLITASKIASELERIADQATNIARRARDLTKHPEVKSLSSIPVMAGEVQGMLAQSIKAFVARDTNLALEIIGRDKLVDAEYKETVRDVEAAIIAHPESTGRELHLLTIAKALERAGDHVKNIAEEVFFLFKGEDIRHTKVSPKSSSQPSS